MKTTCILGKVSGSSEKRLGTWCGAAQVADIFAIIRVAAKVAKTFDAVYIFLRIGVFSFRVASLT